MNKEYLVVLDINGVLGVHVNKEFVLRNDIEQLLNELSSMYNLAIYSSMYEKNIIKRLGSYIDYFLFVAHRDHTKHLKGYKTTKHLGIIFDNVDGSCLDNTIIVDDEAYKVENNPKENTLIVNTEHIIDDYKILIKLIENKILSLREI